ncbi:cytochrome c oxidase subunit 5B, mitochondrial-like [Crassostrea virginica]|uniref:Cytochrome c oxidase subunit 5B, mitochondrial-like n=1 Tax=Crassostrea virginica TaxID=6565 RepID=A0A8B8CCE2_CRAVI|nr:cytochrome c oxidase subunit 5B, mitochondrial-like [Crassostrea virginica]
MASSLRRALPLIKSVKCPLGSTYRIIHTSAPVCGGPGVGLGGGLEDSFKGTIASKKGRIPEKGGHAVGLERFEILCRMEGKDPFEDSVTYVPKGFGTKANPVPVPSIFDRRLVGCICDEDTAQMQYFWLYKGEAKRCFCGHFFQLKEITAADFPQYPREENRTEWEGDL